MSIFRRESEPPPESNPAARPAKPAPRPKVQEKSSASESTHIAKGSKVVGQISGTAALVIDGLVDGEIDLESQVVVGAGGRVEGKILARSVEVGGHVHGNVQGLERVEVLATGSLEGDVLSPRVVIAEGAFFKGKVEMTDKMPQRTSGSAKPPQGKPSPDSQPPSDGGRHQAGPSSEGRPNTGSPSAGAPSGGGPQTGGPQAGGPQAGARHQGGSKNRRGARR